MSSQLLPCPFCGRIPKLDTCSTNIYCPYCYARSPIRKIVPVDQQQGHTEKEIAVMAWNTRNEMIEDEKHTKEQLAYARQTENR